MSALQNAMIEVTATRPEFTVTGGLVLLRIVADGGATRAGVVRDLTPLVSHKLSPAEWRQKAEMEIAALIAAGFCSENRGRFLASEQGRSAAQSFLGLKIPARAAWADLRDVQLVAKALGFTGESASNIKALAGPEGLRALIIQRGFGLPLKGNQSASKLRAELAVVALERAFGNTIKRGFGAGSELSAKAGRVLAGQLSRRPQDYGTDGRLIAVLAAEQAGAAQSDPDSLRSAVLRRLLSTMAAPSLALTPAATAIETRRQTPEAANDTGPSIAAAPPLQAVAPVRPDIAAFSREVQVAARTRAEGWPGNRKAFISHVWAAIQRHRPEWALSEIEFKCMLAEAHRAGHVVLASADLKDKKNIKELQDSAISYKNTVWHLVRVED